MTPGSPAPGGGKEVTVEPVEIGRTLDSLRERIDVLRRYL